jgi:hypothetical protein
LFKLFLKVYLLTVFSFRGRVHGRVRGHVHDRGHAQVHEGVQVHGEHHKSYRLFLLPFSIVFVQTFSKSLFA